MTNKQIKIYPLTKEGQLIKKIEPFLVNANSSYETIIAKLKGKGITSNNYYGALPEGELPEKYTRYVDN